MANIDVERVRRDAKTIFEIVYAPGTMPRRLMEAKSNDPRDEVGEVDSTNEIDPTYFP